MAGLVEAETVEAETVEVKNVNMAVKVCVAIPVPLPSPICCSSFTDVSCDFTGIN